MTTRGCRASWRSAARVVVEVRVGVVPVPHLVDWEVEDGRIEPLSAHARRQCSRSGCLRVEAALSAASATSSWASLGSLVESLR